MKQLSYISFGHKLVEDSNMKTLFCFASYKISVLIWNGYFLL